MTTLLQTYEEEYRDGVRRFNDEAAALQATLNRNAVGYKAPPATGVGSRLQRCSTLTALLAQLRELINNMEYECNDLPAATRQNTKERINEYRSNIKKLEDVATKARADTSAADRLDLIGDVKKPAAAPGAASLPGDLDDETKRHRLMMMENTDKYRQGSQTLNKAERLLNDTEDIGTGALQNLRNQTETMQHINETTIAVDQEVSESRKILNGMHRVMIKHKLILIAVILVLILLIVVAIYVSVSKKENNKPTYTSPPTLSPIPTSPSGDPGNGGIPQL